MSATATSAAAILKTQYRQEKVYQIAYKNNPGLAMARKNEEFGGDSMVIGTQIETPQGGGTTVAFAQSHLAPSIYKRFTLSTRFQDFSLARVTGDAMQAAKGNDFTLINLWTREMDGAIHTVKRSAAIHWYRDGTGTRGFISSGSNVSTNNVTLATPSDATNFSIGLTIQLANVSGGTLRNSGANAVITKIDRTNGILYFGDVLTNYIAAAAANDAILREGDNNNVIKGKSAWVPKTNVTATLFNGLDRTPDPVRLAGQWMNASGMSFREAFIEMISRLDVEGAEPDTIWVHPRDKAAFVKELEGKTYAVREVMAPIKGSDESVGFDAVEVEFDGYKCRVMADINVPRQEAFVEQTDVWELDTLGPFPHIIDYDKLDFLRVYNDDSFEVRDVYRGDVGCLAPAYVGHIIGMGT